MSPFTDSSVLKGGEQTHTNNQVTNEIISVPYALVSLTIRDSIQKNSLHGIQMSQKLAHAKSLDTGINTVTYLFVLPLGF